jgi:hypothetical protein
MRTLRFILALVALTPSLSLAQVVGLDEDVFRRTEEVARGEWFRFFSPTGQITVTEGRGSEVEVRAEKILRSGRTSDIGFIVRRSGGGVTICAVYDENDECTTQGVRSDQRWNNRDRGRNWRPPTLQVTITVPAGIRLSVGSGNGDVAVSGAQAELMARSGNGTVRVNGANGEVEAASGNGAVTVENVRGPVSASSGNGDVRVRAIRGPVSARSGNGDLIISMAEMSREDNMDFTTGNGRIEITFPRDFSGEIDASTSNGGIQTDFPISVTGRITRSRVRGTIGRGGPTIRLVSGNGAIVLRRG